MLFYVLVLRARHGEEIWEGPVRPCHVELQPRGNRRREEVVVELREQIRSALPGVAVAEPDSSDRSLATW